MKKILSLIAAFALAAFTFTSCEDVPAPYDDPSHNNKKEEVGPKGDGTLANPFNVAGILQEAGKLDQGASTPEKVYITGTVTSIKTEDFDPTFGNLTFYIGDGASATKTFYVYRCKGLDGNKVTDVNLIHVGDSVVIYGTVTNYNGTIETQQNEAYIVSINGNGGPGGGDDSGDVLGKGTKDDPYNIAAADSICAGLEKSSTSASYLSDEVYVKGKVSKIVDTEFNTQFKNITYFISEDGTENGTQLEVYRGFGLGNAKFNSLDDLKVGDEVIVCGQLQNFMGTHEFTSGSYLYSLNGKVAEGGGGTVEGATGDGSKDKPFNVAGVINEAGKLQTGASSSSKVYFSGVITEIVECSAEFGNATFYIADDASAKNTFYVYRCLGPGNKKITDENLLNVGDKVTIYGTLTNYKGTLETAQNNAYIYSLNGKVEEGGTGEGGGDDTGGTTGSSEGLSIDGTTVTLANPAFTAGTTTATIDLNTQGWENAQEVTSVTLPDGATITFGAGANTQYPPKFYTGTKGVRCYANNTITFTGKSNIAKVVMDCDEYNGTKYVGSAVATVSFNGSSVVYTNVNDGKNTQLRVKTITIYYAQ